MYTRCPICKTNFSVSEAQLQVAQGKVRCGSCKNVFNARQHIFYQTNSIKPTKTKDNIPPAANKTANTHVDEQTETQPQQPALKKKTDQPANTTEIKIDTSAAHSDIDAIFNALDTQLTSGTYIDIAQPVEADIRETDFDEFDTDNETDLDLDVFRQLDSPTKEARPEADITKENHTEQTATTHNKNPAATKTEPLPSQDNSQTDTKPAQTEHPQKPVTDNSQHTFDFISLDDEPDLSSEDEKQFAAVNKPLDTRSKPDSKKHEENAALHQAIDNIIKVDNSATTPFEEHDADHFVIEMQSEADVELVDEDDIDKLFASTDSLKISDLKFDKQFSNHQVEEPISPLSQNKSQQNLNDETKQNSETDVGVENTPTQNKEIPFNQPLKPENTHQTDSEDEPFDDDMTTSDNFDIDEKIILDGLDDNFTDNLQTDTPVPPRLRDAVHSLEQQQPPLSTAKRLGYSVAVLLLILLLGVQLVLFKSSEIANRVPALQPLLTTLCNRLPCRYTGNHNSKLIKIVSRDVRLHPKIKGALLISATIINQANYAQPYPTILLKFTDLTGHIVAQRYFPPKDYLGQLNKPFALMPSKKPVQLNIEILDPGSDAINFQFFFL